MQTLQIRMPLIGTLLIAFAGLSVVPAADCIAQDALLEAIEAAKSNVTEVPATEVERTHDAVMQATEVLQGYIEASDEETEWGWKDYHYLHPNGVVLANSWHYLNLWKRYYKRPVRD